ncbi:MAG TPA: ABC transporter permease [Verrucomicrobiae bacterium]
MQRLLAIALLTWKAAFRFRLFWVVTVLLLAAVVGLPILIKDDGTARGFTQILLTYTLSVITALLGLCTLWLACGTLARDIEECQMQVVAVKPIARWQIWLGKWLGIMSLNFALLVIAGGSVYGLLLWRATQLPEDQRTVLRKEVMVARGSAKPPSVMADIEAAAVARFKERIAKSPVASADLAEVQKQIIEQVKAEYQVVPPGYFKTWQVNLGLHRFFLQGKPLHLRIKFNAAATSTAGTFTGLWQVGVPETTKLWRSDPMSLAPDTFHEFEVPADLLDENGVLNIAFMNPNETTLLFPLDEGIEVLFQEGGFGLNYLRGLGVIFCWMALLATLGLAAASFLSFPVAAFFSLALLTIAMASGTLATVVTEGTIAGYDSEAGTMGKSVVDPVVVNVFRLLLWLVNLAKDFSPIDSLSTGRSVSWAELGRACGQIVVLLGGLLAAFGIYSFSRRELATAQGTQG